MTLKREKTGMPRTTTGPGGGKRHPLNMRTTKETRDRLEEAAVANGRSLAQEVEARLERSFAEEIGFGGAELRQQAYLMASAFAIAGQNSAAGKPDWLQDTAPYGAAMGAVIDALLIGRPDEALLIESLMGRLLTRRASLKEQQK
jgi:Arc-like DNA binding domain